MLVLNFVSECTNSRCVAAKPGEPRHPKPVKQTSQTDSQTHLASRSVAVFTLVTRGRLLDVGVKIKR